MKSDATKYPGTIGNQRQAVFPAFLGTLIYDGKLYRIHDVYTSPDGVSEYRIKDGRFMFWIDGSDCQTEADCICETCGGSLLDDHTAHNVRIDVDYYICKEVA